MNSLSKEASDALSQVKEKVVKPVTKLEIVFWDFNEYWSDILKERVLPIFDLEKVNITIKKWQTKYDNFIDVYDEEGKLSKTYDTDKLNVFIAPITWHGLYTNKVKIVGPAFATSGDIKLYSLPNKNVNSKKIKIGIIDELATSTIGLQIIMNGICKHIGNLRQLDKPYIEELGIVRLQKLKKTDFLAAVFNSEEYEKHIKGQENVNDIVDIDELYSLAKKIESLPRVVFAITNTQFVSLAEHRTILFETLRKITDKIPHPHNNKYALAPFKKENREAIFNFLKDGLKANPSLSYLNIDTFKKNLV